MLKEFFQKICCCHQWKVHKRVKTFEDSHDKYPSDITETLICTKCGKIKRIRL